MLFPAKPTVLLHECFLPSLLFPAPSLIPFPFSELRLFFRRCMIGLVVLWWHANDVSMQQESPLSAEAERGLQRLKLSLDHASYTSQAPEVRWSAAAACERANAEACTNALHGSLQA